MKLDLSSQKLITSSQLQYTQNLLNEHLYTNLIDVSIRIIESGICSVNYTLNFTNFDDLIPREFLICDSILDEQFRDSLNLSGLCTLNSWYIPINQISNLLNWLTYLYVVDTPREAEAIYRYIRCL